MTRDELRAALDDGNVVALLRVIREGESSQQDSAYTTIYGGAHFDDFSDHPQRVVSAGGYTSSAAGAYQFLARTWSGLVARYGFPDFSPASQDEGAVALIDQAGALQLIRAGDFDGAIAKIAPVWASLPGAPYGQPTMLMDRAKQVYEQWGGSYSSAAAATPIVASQPESDMPAPIFASIAASAAGELLKTLPWFRSDAPEMTVRDRNLAVAGQLAPAVIDALVGSAKEASGQQGVVEATQAVMDRPEVREKFVQTMAARWSEIQPMLEFDEKSRDRAGARAQADKLVGDMAPQLADRAFYLYVGGIAGTLLLIALQTYLNSDHRPMGELVALLVAQVTHVATKWGTIYEYRFGSSLGSKMSGESVRAIAEGRKA